MGAGQMPVENDQSIHATQQGDQNFRIELRPQPLFPDGVTPAIGHAYFRTRIAKPVIRGGQTELCHGSRRCLVNTLGHVDHRNFLASKAIEQSGCTPQATFWRGLTRVGQQCSIEGCCEKKRECRHDCLSRSPEKVQPLGSLIEEGNGVLRRDTHCPQTKSARAQPATSLLSK